MKPVRDALRLIAAALALITFAALWGANSAQARPRNLQELAAINDKLIETGVEHGSISSLYRPRYDRIQDANLSLSDDEVVFIAMLPDGARIYPQRILVWHQVVNEIVSDKAYAVTYCPTTGSFMTYDASMTGLNLIFDAEGRLYDGNSVLIDRNSGSLWLQETGMAFDGPLLGRGLPMLPVYWTRWGAAKRTFPHAQVLAKPNSNKPYGRDPYGNYMRKGTYYDNDRLIYPVARADKRFAAKTPMFCLEYEGYLLAIDIGYVRKKGAVNFFAGPHALLAVYDRGLDVVRVFNRQIWAEPFLFIFQNGNLTDLTTRSLWNPATGAALEGNMKGASMQQFYGAYSMWFAWYSMNPETLAIPGPGEVPDKLLSPAPPGQ